MRRADGGLLSGDARVVEWFGDRDARLAAAALGIGTGYELHGGKLMMVQAKARPSPPT